MKTYQSPKKLKVTKSIHFGSFAKQTLIYINAGEIITVLGETEKFYITDNPINNKLPKWATE
jgi:hypothetical protein